MPVSDPSPMSLLHSSLAKLVQFKGTFYLHLTGRNSVPDRALRHRRLEVVDRSHSLSRTHSLRSFEAQPCQPHLSGGRHTRPEFVGIGSVHIRRSRRLLSHHA